MGIKTVLYPAYSPDLAPCDFWLFPKLRGCRYETIEEMKEAVTKVIDTLTHEDFDGAFQKLLEWYNKCIATGEDYFERDLSFMSVLLIKMPIRKKSGNLFNDPRIISNTRLTQQTKRHSVIVDLKLKKTDTKIDYGFSMGFMSLFSIGLYPGLFYSNPTLSCWFNFLDMKAKRNYMKRDRKRRLEANVSFRFCLYFWVQHPFSTRRNSSWIQMKWLRLPVKVLKCVSR